MVNFPGFALALASHATATGYMGFNSGRPAVAEPAKTVTVFSEKKNCRWLPWGAWASCRGVCGSGVQTRVRRCLGGVAGKDCVGNTLDSRACNDPQDDTCSYWSGWGQWSAPSSSCGLAQRCKSRTCYGRNTDHCHGPTQMCENVDNPAPIPQTFCDPPSQKCCPAGQPNCCVKQCYTTHACTTERTILPVQACDMQLPCCDEWSAYGEWSPVTASCFTTSVTRQRHNLCDPKQIEVDAPRQIDLGEGNYGEWMVSAGCNGQMVGTHQCPGILTYSRDHSCYTQSLHRADRQGNALEFVKTAACGSMAPTQLGDWDKTDAQCASMCRNLGIFRSRKTIQPCTGQVVDEEVEACGILGGWGEFSDWTVCSATCGGTQWRWRLHSCDTDKVTGRPLVDYEQRGCLSTGPQVGGDTWGAFGQWSDTCADAYPAACADGLRSRQRLSACGVKDAVTGVVQYEQTETATCPKPVRPEPVVTISDCSATCIDQSTPQSIKYKTTTEVCKADVVEAITCSVPECCKWILTEEWSECDCTGTQYWMKQNTCPYIAAEKITRSCMKPTQPYQEFSLWSACSTSCPEQGMQSRFSCPRCEANVETCAMANREVRRCPGANPRRTVEEACVASCGQEGSMTVYELDICTSVKYNERQVPCNLPMSPRPEWDMWGECVHDRNNVNCPGKRVRKLPAWIDPNTNQICAPEDYEIQACGPTAEPENVLTQWTACSATTNCIQEQEEYNTCTGFRKTNTKNCMLPMSDFSLWSQCSPITMSYDKQHICDGTQSRSQKDPCGRQADKYETRECGLIYQLASAVDLTEATFFDSHYHYYDCQRDAQQQPLWTGCTAVCPDNVGSETFVAKGIEMIARKSICPNKWNDITISRECYQQCTTCDAPQWDAWTQCSSDCEIGFQSRRQFKMCYDHKTNTKTRVEITSENRNCGQAREQTVSNTACISANACANGMFCGIGSRNVITTAVSLMATCPAERKSIEISTIAEPCPLPACPSWGPFQGDSCGMCSSTRTLYRTCNKPLGAEMCDCVEGPVSTTEMCMPSNEFGDWSEYSLCSASCGMGTQYKTRAKICDPTQQETDTRTCQITAGEWMVVIAVQNSVQLVPVTPDAGWSACSSFECVSGIQERTLRHTCTGENRKETKTCSAVRYPEGGTYEDQQWVQVSSCSQTCGEGLETWSRPHSCKKYNNLADEVTYKKCVVSDAAPGAWDQWSACKKCGTDSQSRSRRWSCAGYGTQFASSQGLEYESRACAIPACAYWDEWKYTPCTCNRRENGYRTRTCIGENAALGITCEGPSYEIVPCNNQDVGAPMTLLTDRTFVAQGSYTLTGWRLIKDAWSNWSGCALTCSPTGECGSEMRTQKTFCVDTSGQYEENVAAESRACPCAAPVSAGIEWQGCSASDPTTCPGVETGIETFTCGGQSKTHSRSCGVSGTWGAWSGYSACTKDCGGGLRQRSRSWTCAADGRANQVESASCNDHSCNYYGAWSNWGACSVSCGIGTMSRTRYCHGGNDGTGLCIVGSKGVGKLDTARCDMGKCCEWDWSGWTSCCQAPDRQKNIRLRFRGNQCGSDWEVIEKTCENQPIADPRNPFISCSTIRQNNHLSYQSNSKWVEFVNPDKVTTQVLPGTVLGHKDDPNKVKTATWYNTQTTVTQTVPVAPIYTPSPTNYYFGRNQVAYNSKPYVAPAANVVATPVVAAPVVAAPVVAAPVVSAPVVSSYKTTVSQNPPQYIIDQAANASSKTVMSGTQILGGGKIAATVAEKKVTAVETPAKTASTMNFLWSIPNMKLGNTMSASHSP